MSELSREDFQAAFDKQASQSAQQSRDMLAATNGLAHDFRELAAAITQQVQHATTHREKLGTKNGENRYGLIALVSALAAIVSPMYIMVSSSRNDVADQSVEIRQIVERERLNAEGHGSLMERIKSLEREQWGVVPD